MAQNDFTIDNQSFPATRADINSAIQALATLSSGPTAPATPFANQFWMDTTTDPYVLKIRNSANNQWITVAEVNQGSVYFAITAYLFATSGTVTAPSISFSGDRDTGLYSVGANTLGITTNGTLRYQFGPDGELGIASNYGTSGQYLQSSGIGSAPIWKTFPTSSTVYTSGSGNWTRPSAGTFCLVRIWGGGGGGGHGGGTASRGAGGGGGSYAERFYFLSSMGATEPYSVGAGGAGRTSAGNGGDGTSSSFGTSGSTLITAYGGSGGQGNLTTSNSGMGAKLFANASGQTSTPADASQPWHGSDGGNTSSGTYDGFKSWMGGAGGGGAVNSIAGAGGISFGGSNGGAGSYTTAASNGTSPAGGGGGYGPNNTSVSSGSGGNGQIEIIVW